MNLSFSEAVAAVTEGAVLTVMRRDRPEAQVVAFFDSWPSRQVGKAYFHQEECSPPLVSVGSKLSYFCSVGFRQASRSSARI